MFNCLQCQKVIQETAGDESLFGNFLSTDRTLVCRSNCMKAAKPCRSLDLQSDEEFHPEGRRPGSAVSVHPKTAPLHSILMSLYAFQVPAPILPRGEG